jgi:uncharacterized protein (DUF1800 family)
MSIWTPYQPKNEAPWNVERVVHLHRRAAFAATWSEVQRDLSEGPEAAIHRLLRGHERSNFDADFEAMSQNIAHAAIASNNANRLKAWWFFRMLRSPDPLGERLTLMWHNHFATSNRKVENLLWMHDQNQVLRAHSRGTFRKLLSATVKQPAMLKWLDADANRKGHPNENLGRELLELFTLGIGNYSENDIQSAARALTGWTIKKDEFVYQESRHDDGQLELFGSRLTLDGDGLLQQTLEHPATVKRLAWRICSTFMGENTVDEAALADLAAGLQRQDLNIGWAVETVLKSERFFSANNLRTRITSPTEHVISAVKALELDDSPPNTLQLSEWSTRMGQDLFYPPNVGGWNGGRSWLGSRSVVARCNFANAVATGQLWQSSAPGRVESSLTKLLEQHAVGRSLRDRAQWLATLLYGTSTSEQVAIVIGDLNNSETPLSHMIARLLASPEYYLA